MYNNWSVDDGARIYYTGAMILICIGASVKEEE
jgi:hypothetical protein